MKEAFFSTADRERRKIVDYLKQAQHALETNPDFDEDPSFILEMIVDRLDEYVPGKPLDFQTKDLGM